LPPEQLLSLCMIVKNEERTLGDCLRSVRGVVDEIVIVDTGSTDGTLAVAGAYNAKVFHFPWNGSFSDARNEALAHCSCTYVLYLDADERLEDRDRDRLRNLVRRPSFDAYELNVVSKKTEGKRVVRTSSDQARLFRRDPVYRFKYRIHETIVPSVREAGGRVKKENITIHHVGYEATDAVMELKKQRNYEQLVKDVADYPNDLFVQKKYIQTLMLLGKPAEAAEQIDLILRKIDAGDCGEVGAPRRAAFCNLYAEALITKGDFASAHFWANESLRTLKDQNTAHYYLTMINDHLEKYDEALHHLNSIIVQRPEGSITPAEDNITPAQQDICYKRAALYRAMKKPLDERRELVAALRLDPGMTTALYDLAAFMAKEKNYTQALSLITKALETDPANGSILHLRGRILQQMQRKEEALRDAAAAFQRGETGDQLLMFWIQAAKDAGREIEALRAYDVVVDRHPEAVDVLMSYIQLLVQLKDISTALAVIDRSLPLVKDETLKGVLQTIHGKLAFAGQVLS
jgi:glycosyltransferase involved in cell wall biosynthesis